MELSIRLPGLIALAFLILSESGISFIPILLIGKIALWSAGILTLYTGYDYLKSGFLDRAETILIKLSNEVEIVNNFSIPTSFDLCITLAKSLNNGS